MSKLMLPFWTVAQVTMEGDDAGELGTGLSIVDDDSCETVCDLHVHLGHSLAPYENDERNARLIAAAPQLLQELFAMVKLFRGPAASLGAEHHQALADAMQAIRLTLSDEDPESDDDEGLMQALGRFH